MARIRQEIQPQSGERLKLLCRRHGITQSRLSEMIDVSKNTLSGIATGTKAMTHPVASLITEVFPGTRTEWLMGIDDYETEKDLQINNLSKMFSNDRMVSEGFQLLAESKGFTITQNERPKDNDTVAPSGNPVEWYDNKKEYYEELKSWLNDAYTVHNGMEAVSISLEQYFDLQEECADYVEMRLNRIIQRNQKREE